MSDEYAAFLARKAILDPPTGLAEPPELPWGLKPFQRAITNWALRRGRAAIFANTGLGKTLMQTAWARAVADYEHRPVLLLCPLAVAEQTVAEAAKFGIPGVAYAADQAQVKSDIVVSNYERFDKFHIAKFCGIVLDESGIIKSQDSATRKLLTEACAGMKWKLCCTATPAPNDYAELGQHAEFLGVMRAKEMLATFFVHDGSIRAKAEQESDWRLKRHAERDFWRWLASWSVMIRAPEDIGFEAPEYGLPPLELHQITVSAEWRPTAGMLFPAQANTLGERIGVRRDTFAERCKAAAEIVTQEPGAWLVWCHLNAEADLMETLIPEARQVAGKHDVETKIGRLLGFKSGDPLVLVSKPSIAGHGLHYAHCSHMVFVGLNDSFEQLYQAIRRCWRFGQTRPVHVYLVASELEGSVVANLKRKERDYETMLDAMTAQMRDLMQENLRGVGERDEYDPQIQMEIPGWLLTA